MGLQETWASPALLAGGFEPGTDGGATRGLGFCGSRGSPSAASAAPGTSVWATADTSVSPSPAGPREWGGRRATESTLQDLWGVQGEKGFREIQESTTEVCVCVRVMGSDFIYHFFS